MPPFARPLRVAEARLWLLCRKFCSFRLIPGRGVRQGRIAAVWAPPHGHKYGSAVNVRVMKRLPESALVSLLHVAFPCEGLPPDVIRVGAGSHQVTRRDER